MILRDVDCQRLSETVIIVNPKPFKSFVSTISPRGHIVIFIVIVSILIHKSFKEVKKNYFTSLSSCLLPVCLQLKYKYSMKKILIYNSGGGLGDSIQLFPLLLSLKSHFKKQCLFVSRDVGTGGARGARAPPDFGNLVLKQYCCAPRISNLQSLLLGAPPPEFQTFLRPCLGTRRTKLDERCTMESVCCNPFFKNRR